MAKVTRLTLNKLRQELARFEAKYGISSQEFYERLLNWEIDGTRDNDAWAVLCGKAVQAGLIVPPPPTPNGSLGEVDWLTPERIRELLAEYESKHCMSSAAFYERYMAGLEGDSGDAMESAWLHELSVKKGLKPSPSHA